MFILSRLVHAVHLSASDLTEHFLSGGDWYILVSDSLDKANGK